MNNPLTLRIVEDDERIREMLRAVFIATPAMRVEEVYGSVEEALDDTVGCCLHAGVFRGGPFRMKPSVGSFSAPERSATATTAPLSGPTGTTPIASRRLSGGVWG